MEAQILKPRPIEALVTKKPHRRAPAPHATPIGFDGVLDRLVEPMTKRELQLRKSDEKSLPLPPTSANRCWAGMVEGQRCTLPRGHYRHTSDASPSPHRDENGTVWFGAKPR
jgi:hypothetical protein